MNPKYAAEMLAKMASNGDVDKNGKVSFLTLYDRMLEAMMETRNPFLKPEEFYDMYNSALKRMGIDTDKEVEA